MPDSAKLSERAATLIKRDLLLALRRAGWLNPVVFLAVVLSLVAVALKGELQASPLLAPALLWAGLLLASLLATEAMFSDDHSDGSLEQLLVQQRPTLLLAARLLAQVLTVGLPLCLASALFALALGVPLHALPALAATLPAGVMALTLLGSFGSALALGRGGLLASVLATPLALPIMLFAVAALEAALTGTGWLGAALRLWLLAIALAVAIPVAVTGALRLHLE